MRPRDGHEDIRKDWKSMGRLRGGAFSGQMEGNRVIRRSLYEDDSWMERRIGAKSRTLTKPAWSRNLGSGTDLVSIFSHFKAGDRENTKLIIVTIIYVVMVVLAWFSLPTEAMLGWIAVNIGIGLLALRHIRRNKEKGQDLSYATFYEGIQGVIPSEACGKMVAPRRKGARRTKTKESYELFTESAVSIESRRIEQNQKRKLGVITFPHEDSDIDLQEGKREVRTIRKLDGKVSFDDSEEVGDTGSEGERTIPCMGDSHEKLNQEMVGEKATRRPDEIPRSDKSVEIKEHMTNTTHAYLQKDGSTLSVTNEVALGNTKYLEGRGAPEVGIRALGEIKNRLGEPLPQKEDVRNIFIQLRGGNSCAPSDSVGECREVQR